MGYYNTDVKCESCDKAIQRNEDYKVCSICPVNLCKECTNDIKYETFADKKKRWEKEDDNRAQVIAFKYFMSIMIFNILAYVLF